MNPLATPFLATGSHPYKEAKVASGCGAGVSISAVEPETPDAPKFETIPMVDCQPSAKEQIMGLIAGDYATYFRFPLLKDVARDALELKRLVRYSPGLSDEFTLEQVSDVEAPIIVERKHYEIIVPTSIFASCFLVWGVTDDAGSAKELFKELAGYGKIVKFDAIGLHPRSISCKISPDQDSKIPSWRNPADPSVECIGRGPAAEIFWGSVAYADQVLFADTSGVVVTLRGIPMQFLPAIEGEKRRKSSSGSWLTRFLSAR
jgi:hypothetical protein